MSPESQVPLSEDTVPAYLVALGVIPEGIGVSIENPGEGNINWVRRARPDSGPSWIVKQARPALERFPEYRVSTDRIRIEARYYETVAPFDSEHLCPRVHHFDDPQRVLVLEDLGQAERLDQALARGAALDHAFRSLGRFLGAVHQASHRDDALIERFANDEMRRLHGEHIFQIPYRWNPDRQNEFGLASRVAERAVEIQRDRDLVALIDACYARYLEPSGALVHADVQPTNILLDEDRPRLIDPEIAHVGDPAFDVGILLAHLLLHGVARDQRVAAVQSARETWTAYAGAHGSDEAPEFSDAIRYAGIELLRRSIGAARTPESEREDVALPLIELGVALVKSPPGAPDDLARVV
jgi:5-methylthioribose kinase